MTDSSLRTRTLARWAEHNPDLDTSPMEVVAQVKRIAALLELAAENVYTGAALTAAEMELLVPLRYAETSVTAIRLAELLGMSRAGVSKTLAKLQTRGMISRTPNPDDRRSALITLSNKGIHAVDDMFPRELEAHGALLAGLGRQRQNVLDALSQLAQTMESQLQRSRGD
ncbi:MULTISPECIES: MarR family winged helix-turn-helix transcriptional regulator [unclassified Mycolicibacterium]|uniref:MarR family winged helix-turn-helix transcriptional regulator n=2 Tax=Mycolicibacterium TaxID=1866885 RepID=UPI0012DF48B0|nr:MULTISPECIES: MarR family transcriptional regulator [unclassified Mycolicibacterium]MUL82807.1 MarR family transcriptional regulator [Mycolicibacterium sp. CBMA 329]MUL89142.1 MarR family transcriptional regulator [Mycolicibacterium sp. CBMA 331]MUL97709.1 MarR family transcriptional regulator [Mycolicibacterium sp. CBMA 334]MUM38658.1 MarR family transcriptional regulator [Mycolicibacterium sp. CBMA 247]MUM45206.1 MarR family transcriptional regulator [Mycolicibacterium sp. CBMA 294]